MYSVCITYRSQQHTWRTSNNTTHNTNNTYVVQSITQTHLIAIDTYHKLSTQPLPAPKPTSINQTASPLLNPNHTPWAAPQAQPASLPTSHHHAPGTATAVRRHHHPQHSTTHKVTQPPQAKPGTHPHPPTPPISAQIVATDAAGVSVGPWQCGGRMNCGLERAG
ncbi:hypothetical protein J1614_008394 [Plenodomus biglobosus]|nr:hypothetical protein J1614_008394 [Plenodomus biglobosus]